MTGRIVATYRTAPGAAAAVAEAIRVEQTIEFPAELAPAWIRDEIVGRTERVDGGDVAISFDPRVAAGGLGQLLNVLWGNVSLFDGVRLVAVDLPDTVLAERGGPRFGVAGLRERWGAVRRPLLMTALKPMGRSPDELASDAATLSAAGFDVIKDDHSLADQPWARRGARIAAVVDAVAAANDRAGTRAVYAPSLNSPADRIVDDAHAAVARGAGALLVLPGLSGFDAMRALADDDSLAVPLIAHPAFLGAHAVHPDHGIDHGVLFGTFMRLAGADVSIFPHHGGRFTFPESACAAIAGRCRARLGGLAPIWPSPGGGMNRERMPEIVEFYGRDVTLLIGGALHRGDLATNAAALAEFVRSLD